MQKQRLFSLLLLLTLCLAAPARAMSDKIVFEGRGLERKWTLKELGPDFPADWSAYDYLTLELRASSPQRFDLRVYTAAGVCRVRVAPFQGAWTRVSVPMTFLTNAAVGHDLAAAHNRSLPSSFLNLGGFAPVNAVQSLAVSMDKPIGRPTLEIRNVHLTKGAAEDAVIEPRLLVDEFGQWIPAQWPGKATTLEALKAAWAKEEQALAKSGAAEFDMCGYGGFKSTHAKATGFFHVEEVDGKSWFVDPDGHLFFSVGSDCMGPGSATPTVGRDGVFAALPPADLLRSPTSRFRRRPSGRSASFLSWNLQRRFGPEWRAKWVDLSVRRMDAWGLNTIANWSDPSLWDAGRKPYVVNLGGWGVENGWLGLPDVYSDSFARQCDEAAREQCAQRKNDPYLLGYFIANEPAWPGQEKQLTDMILAGQPSATQRELKAFLAQGDTPERRREFVYRAFEKFLAVTNGAVKKHDPNHLSLGLRFGGKASDELLRACGIFDVFSMNCYDYKVDRNYIEKAHRLSGRPVIIGEFHFGVPGRGLSPGLKQTANQEERGAAYRYYVEQAAAIPCLIGVHWFQWVDQPNTGRNDGENYNIGVVDVTDRPYEELVSAMQATHKRLHAVHSGKASPVTRQAKLQ